MRYLFLDTFALVRMTKDHSANLSNYLRREQFHLVISPLQLIEYYNPILQSGDRTARAVTLLAEHPFVIVNQDDIYEREESVYPGSP